MFLSDLIKWLQNAKEKVGEQEVCITADIPRIGETVYTLYLKEVGEPEPTEKKLSITLDREDDE